MEVNSQILGRRDCFDQYYKHESQQSAYSGLKASRLTNVMYYLRYMDWSRHLIQALPEAPFIRSPQLKQVMKIIKYTRSLHTRHIRHAFLPGKLMKTEGLLGYCEKFTM